MKMKVLGVQSVDYVSRKTGNPVKGVTLHCAYKDSSVQGDMVEQVFISDSLDIKDIANVRPGVSVDVEYNRRGYVANLAIVG